MVTFAAEQVADMRYKAMSLNADLTVNIQIDMDLEVFVSVLSPPSSSQ